MKNRFFITILFLSYFGFVPLLANANEQFNFNIAQIEIQDNGNKIIGSKRGTITSDDGITFTANKFEYDKKKNLLIAEGNVEIENKFENYKIFSEDILYSKNEEIISTSGKTKIFFQSKYEVETYNLNFLKDNLLLTSNQKTTIVDIINNTFYSLQEFSFSFKSEILKGKKILANHDYKQPNNTKIFFESGIFDLKDQSHVAKDIEVKLKKDIFDNSENDPRLKGVSSVGSKNITTINKGIFTSCKQTEKCPPWVLKAKKVKHDKTKKLLIYDGAVLEVYNFPILYFPKFFHPDPTVKRQSGFLQPSLSNSNILGSSFSIPYYKIISKNKDITLRPTIFENEIQMLQNEYRQVNKNSSFIADFSYNQGYKSSLSNSKNSISHLFAKFNKDLRFDNYITSSLDVSIEKVSNDTYLKVFDGNIAKTPVTPNSKEILTSEIKLFLDHEDFNFSSGFQSFENLELNNTDRYQFVLPYYNFDKDLFTNFKKGFVNIFSSGSNVLKDTNNLVSTIINDINFQSIDFFSNNGLKNNINIYLKNLNIVAKNDTKHSSKAELELMSLFEFNSKLPLSKESLKNRSYLTPKLSLKINPGDMKNYKSEERFINADNIFASNRLGISDSFEAGESVTIGVDYKKERLSDINKYFEIKLASSFRREKEGFIPSTSSLGKKNSNLFGSINNSFSEVLKIGYDFSLEEDLNTFEYNSINADFNFKNISANVNFIEETGAMGGSNVLENSIKMNLGNNNFLSFNTRRNRKINLTEYYNFIYEYKNDCLTAGIRYNKTFYEDRELKPSENLLFTITLYPLTTIEQKVAE